MDPSYKGKKSDLDLRCLPFTTASTLPNSKKFMRMESNETNESLNSTIDRKQMHRLSWMNMRRKDEMIEINKEETITPSPKTTRSYISNVSTVENTAFCSNGYTTSGRTTATSGRISSSGVTTISSSNNTLNDLHSDYHCPQVNINSINNRHHLTSIQSIPSPTKSIANGSFNLANGSTIKLIGERDDEKNQQTKCSVFRGLILCVCLNVTYANVVRFPRELDNYGSVFLIPYVILLFLVGLPLILLEISVGQFLGQGAAHTWRASPIFKGACIISRFASWLSTVWISIQAVIALAYVGMYSFNSMPFRECLGKITANHSFRYHVTAYNGQECIEHTFLKPFWENPLYFGMLSIGLICIWIALMLCTHNGKILRRCLFLFGLFGFILMSSLTAMEVHNSLGSSYFPDFWRFDSFLLVESNIWFNALMQVLFSVNCGFGVLPTITGKFLYKGDAVRTSVVYLCFKLLINAIAVTLFMVQFDKSENPNNLIVELKPFTAIYDRFLRSKPQNEVFAEIMPPLMNFLIVICSVVSIIAAIYTATRIVPRRPNYVICLIALVASIMSFSAPRFIIARILDSQIVGTLIITALIFEIIAITWIYGIKNIYTDLEFSIGRPILKGWMWLWCITPAILTGILVWWCADDDSYDVLPEYVPRWAPILFVLGIILIIAGIEVFHQVDYNFFGMICEASKPAKEWGPADPLARHAWKQWRSVCQDTGRRDFTLRRRGTRDYTHSIKKGQYSGSSRYAGNLSNINNGNSNGGIVAGGVNGNGVINGPTNHTNWKSSTPGNSSPNYSGSMFGDSAIEEDISVDKFPGISQQFVPYHQHQPQQQHSRNHNPVLQSQDVKISLRYSNRKRAQPHRLSNSQQAQLASQQQISNQQINQNQQHNSQHIPNLDKHREIVYIRRLSDDSGKHATRIEITPSNESITYANISAVRNPLARSSGSHGNEANYVKRSSSINVLESNRNPLNGVTEIIKRRPPPPPKITSIDNSDHICWRKYNANPEEYSTEL